MTATAFGRCGASTANSGSRSTRRRASRMARAFTCDVPTVRPCLLMPPAKAVGMNDGQEVSTLTSADPIISLTFKAAVVMIYAAACNIIGQGFSGVRRGLSAQRGHNGDSWNVASRQTTGSLVHLISCPLTRGKSGHPYVLARRYGRTRPGGIRERTAE